jgi:hypothetical protein
LFFFLIIKKKEDAEGTFTVVIVKENKKSIIGWRVLPKYQICLHIRDIELLLRIQQFFGGIGSIYKTGNLVFYTVSKLKDLTDVILPHFNDYTLLTQKAEDFRLFKMVVFNLVNKDHLTMEGLRKIVNIKATLNIGLSHVVKSEFEDIKPEFRRIVNTEKIPDPYWLTGFVNGEGTFDVKIYKSKSKIGQSVQLRFRISQHERDTQLMELIKKYLGCGQIEKHSKHKAVALVVTRFSDNTNKLIPFFVLYPLEGIKNLDFLD